MKDTEIIILVFTVDKYEEVIYGSYYDYWLLYFCCARVTFQHGGYVKFDL